MLLYVLSIGPVAILWTRTSSEAVATTLDTIYSPLERITNKSKTTALMRRYVGWWRTFADTCFPEHPRPQDAPVNSDP